jgi:hypothetical protein
LPRNQFTCITLLLLQAFAEPNKFGLELNQMGLLDKKTEKKTRMGTIINNFLNSCF